MATITRKNFPGVYSQIIDQSLTATNSSRFKPGLIGVASKGPFDIATKVATSQDFVRLFGQPIPNTFLGTALGIVAPFTNGAVVVRVGNKYQPLPSSSVSFAVTGTAGNTFFTTAGAPFVDSTVNPLPVGSTGYFVEVIQTGSLSLVNAPVTSVQFGSIVNVTGTLPASFNNGQMLFSAFPDAASKAQSILEGYIYSGNLALGTVTGVRGAFTFNVTSAPAGVVNVGDLLTLTQSGKFPTQEVYVSAVSPFIGGVAIISLQPTNDTERGYLSLPLQDTYTGASVQRAVATTSSANVYALTEGTWGNTVFGNPTTGLQVKVAPGSSPGTKKLQIYSDSTLVEVYDNLGNFTTPSPAALPFNATINTTTPSNYIQINVFGTVVPANTVDPWNLAATLPVVSSPTNNANPNSVPPGGAFSSGFNGENAQNADFVGRYDPVNDVLTGIKAFEDTDNVDVNVLCAPGVTSTDASFLGAQTQLRDTAVKTKSIAFIDVPFALNGVPLTVWSAIDWHNGVGQFSAHGQFNSAYMAAFWNWFTMTDPLTQTSILAPPTVGALRCMAFTWIHDQPWYAIAGVNRGVIQEATAITFPKISDDAKEALDAPGNGLNPIIQSNGQILLFGERTMLRIPPGTTDKLTAIHNLVLVEFVVKGLAAIGRTKVFDPNDLTLLGQLNLAMTQFLKGVQALRGIEAFQLVCDSSNNNADTRNNREVIVDLFVVPTDVAERIYINATVNQSGAIVNNVTG